MTEKVSDLRTTLSRFIYKCSLYFFLSPLQKKERKEEEEEFGRRKLFLWKMQFLPLFKFVRSFSCFLGISHRIHLKQRCLCQTLQFQAPVLRFASFFLIALAVLWKRPLERQRHFPSTLRGDPDVLQAIVFCNVYLSLPETIAASSPEILWFISKNSVNLIQNKELFSSGVHFEN